VRLAAVSNAMLASSAFQQGGLEYSSRQQAQQQVPEFQGSMLDSTSKSHERFETPHGSVSRPSTNLLDDEILHSFQKQHPLAGNGFNGFSAGHVESVGPRSAGPTLANSPYMKTPYFGDAEVANTDSRVLSGSSTPNSASHPFISQSLGTDDVEAKRAILAEV
jgi:hypothetical protein